MTHRHCFEVKVVVGFNGVNTRKHIGRSEAAQQILVGNKINITHKSKVLKKMLESVGCVVLDGADEGCYGANGNSTSAGFTVWVDANNLPERKIIDDGKQEQVNIFKLIENFGGKLIEGLDGDRFSETCEALGLDVQYNNTYNYAGHSKDSPSFMIDADFAVIHNKDKSDAAYLSIKFHRGGDIRGNYTERVVYKFDSIDDVFGVVMPSCELIGGENE